MNITKAIIPAAGHGTRFLPFTKAVPKEMLPLLNKPAIHYIVDELVTSAIKNCLMITAPHKQAIERYFDTADHLEKFLQEKNKLNLLADLPQLIEKISFSYIHQIEAHGLGHAVLQAEPYINNEYFGIALPDDIIIHSIAGLAQLIKIAQEQQANVIAVQEVPKELVSAYGVIAIKKQISSELFEVANLVEKPTAHDAPSNLAIIGRYILSSELFKSLHQVKPAKNGEIQLTDGISDLIKKGQKVFAYKIQGTRYDVGTPTGWLSANLDLARKDQNYSSLF